jgi:serine phosphatase RsbU (regulator of sigma subunit)
MNLKGFTFQIALLLLLVVSLEVQAHGPKYVHLAQTATIAEDVNHEWTAEEIAQGKFDQAFEAINDPIPNLDFTTSTFWVKITISNTHDHSSDYYLEVARALTNVVNLYQQSGNKATLLHETGDDLPFDKRPMIYRKFMFPITLNAGESIDYLIQVRSDGEVINLPIKLWDQTNFNAFVQRENLTLGIYYGLLIFVTGLFLFFAFVIRHKIYSYYVSYVICLFFMQASLDGLAFEYIWRNWPWFANHSILFFSGASVFTLMLYAAEFLKVQRMPKWFRIVYRTLIGIVVICIVTSLTSGITYELTYPIINGMSLLSILAIILGIAWNQTVNKNVNLFFALGFISVLIGGTLFILTNFNIIFSDFLSHNAIKLGSAAEITFLSLAMVGRYRDIQKDKETAQEEAFQNLEKLNDLAKVQNEMLEEQVKERTAVIEEKSEELEQKNKEIIDSITYAKRIQEAILPPNHSIQKELPNSFVLYIPKDIVAGDFYWMETYDFAKSSEINAEENVVLIAAADCTGHGVPGAMVSVVCHGALNRSVREFGLTKPSEILDKTAMIVDETFEKSEEEVKDGMDISLCAIYKSSSTIEWAGANNPIWIISPHNYPELGDPSLTEDGINLFEIKADKQPIGRYPNRKSYTNHKLSLKEGDQIFLFSDGYPDQFGGEKGKKYKSKNFKKFLLSISEHPMTEQERLIHFEFNHWRGNLEQIDDVCVIGIRL